MNISGTTNTCTILANTPFILSGLSQTNQSTVNITDLNGLDVSQCYGISSSIITVTGDNVIHSGDCDTSLEILITSGVTLPVECLYTGYTEQQDTGLVLFKFTGGTTSLNVHPDCCLGLSYTPEIGVDHYYVCRWGDAFDPTDCNNYTYSNNGFDINNYAIFQISTGGTTTIVPSEQCCLDNGFIGVLRPEGTHCIEEVVYDPCEGLTVKGVPPLTGDIIWENLATGNETNIVPTAECCTSEGFNSRINTKGGGFICYNSLAEKPTFSLTNDPCCLSTTSTAECKEYSIFANTGTQCTAEYIGCDGIADSIIIPNGDEAPVCSIVPPTIKSGSGTITITGLDNCNIGNCTSYRLVNGTQSDLLYSYISCDGLTISDFMSGFTSLTICAKTGTVTFDTGISNSVLGSC